MDINGERLSIGDLVTPAHTGIWNVLAIVKDKRDLHGVGFVLLEVQHDFDHINKPGDLVHFIPNQLVRLGVPGDHPPREHFPSRVCANC